MAYSKEDFDRVIVNSVSQYPELAALYQVGEVLTLTVYETTGDVRPDAGSPFALDYAIAPQDGLIKISMDSLLIPGAAPIDIATLRELCKYPALLSP